MDSVTPFLMFDGRVEEALNFYVSTIRNSRIVELQRNGDAVMGGTFELDGRKFLCFNGGPHFSFSQGVSLFVNCETQEEVDALWEKFAAGGEPQRCGWIKDKFGLSWQIIPSILGKYLQDKDRAKANRVMQAMLQMVKIDIEGLKRAYARVSRWISTFTESHKEHPMNIQTKVKPVASRQIKVTRTFEAPRALVFSMFTDAKHLAAWWGPHGFTNPVCEVDARPNGKIRIHMQAPDGTVHPMGGIFHEIVPPERIVFTSFVDLPDGQRILEGHNTVTFAERNGRNDRHRQARADGYVDFAARMLAGMEAGWSQSLDKLASHGAHETGAKDADDQTAIRAIFGDRTNALFGKVVDLAVKHFADDIVSYDLAPPLQHVGPGREGMQEWFDTWDGPIAFAMATSRWRPAATSRSPTGSDT